MASWSRSLLKEIGIEDQLGWDVKTCRERILDPMKRLATFLLILFCLGAAPAAPQQDDLAKRFVGAWRLVSVEGVPPGLPSNLYDRPTRLIFYRTPRPPSPQLISKPHPNP